MRDYMTFQPPETSFEIDPWPQVPAWRNDEFKKQLFGQELIKGTQPFAAALSLFPNDTNAALWVSQNWIKDELVLKIVNNEEKDLKILDKEQLANKVLQFADEKDPSGRFHVHEGKDRLAALRLYAEISGHIGKNEVNNNTFNNTSNTMNIRLVAPEKKQDEGKIIEHEPRKADVIPLKVKLVS